MLPGTKRRPLHRPRHLRRSLFTLWLLGSLFVGVVFGREVMNDTNCIIRAGERSTGTHFVLCQNLIIEGELDGTLIGAAIRTTINGTISKSVYLVGGQLDIGGRLGSDLHFVGANLNISDQPYPVDAALLVITGGAETTVPDDSPDASPDAVNPFDELTGQSSDGPAVPVITGDVGSMSTSGSDGTGDGGGEADQAPLLPAAVDVVNNVTGNVLAATLSTTVGRNVTIGGSMLDAGYQLIIDGSVGDEVSFWGTGLELAGSIGGNLYASVGSDASDGSQIETLLLPLSFVQVDLGNGGLRLLPNSRVVGSLVYEASDSQMLQGIVESGNVVYRSTDVALPTLEEPGTISVYIDNITREATSLWVIGMLGLLLAPRLIQRPIPVVRYRPLSSFSIGMLSFILSFPIFLIILVLSVVFVALMQLIGLSGIALAMTVVLGLINVGGLSIFYFVAIFVARVIIGLSVGRVLLRIAGIRTRRTRDIAWSFTAGILLLALAVSLPIVGWLINALILFLGLGAILSLLLTRFRALREAEATEPTVWRGPSPLLATATTGYGATMPVLPGTRPVTPARGLVVPAIVPLPTAQKPEHVVDQRGNIVEPPAPLPLDPGSENLPPGFDPDFFLGE